MFFAANKSKLSLIYNLTLILLTIISFLLLFIFVIYQDEIIEPKEIVMEIDISNKVNVCSFGK